MLTVVALEWEVDFEPALLTLQMLGLQTLNFHTNIEDSSLLILAVDTMADLTMPKCEGCWNESNKLEKCQFCGKSFCEVDYPEHMARERRHEGLAKDEGEFWRQKRERSS